MVVNLSICYPSQSFPKKVVKHERKTEIVMLQSVFRSRGFNTKGWGDKYVYKIDTNNPHSRCKMVGFGVVLNKEGIVQGA